MPDRPADSVPRNVGALALVAIIGVAAWSGGGNSALSADNAAWLGRWAIVAETCQNDSYDMLIEPDHFEIWEQGCDIKDWRIKGDLAILTMQCFNEGNAVTNEGVQLLVSGDTIKINPTGGAGFTSRTMDRCR